MFSTLTWLDSQTTPEAVHAARHGVTINCPAGGTVVARFAANDPSVLRLTWNACDVQQQPIVRYDGKGRLRLPAQTFKPDFLEALHLGSAEVPMVRRQVDEAFPDNHYDTLYDAHLVGRVSLTRSSVIGGVYTGEFDYSVNGTVRERSTSAAVEPETIPFVQESIYTAAGVRVVGSVVHSESDTVVTEDLNVRRGTFALAYQTTYAPLFTTNSFTAYNWHVNRQLRVLDRTSAHSVSGRVDYRQFSPYTTSCGNGVYSFRTIVPIRYVDVSRYDARDQGQVVVNGSIRATFSLSAEPSSNPDWYTPMPGQPATQLVIKQGQTELLNTTSYYMGSTLYDIGRCPSI